MPGGRGRHRDRLHRRSGPRRPRARDGLFGGTHPVNIEPLTAERWDDLATLFGPNGANSGCWCMWWRVPAKEWTDNGNAGNRTGFEAVVRRGEPAGLLAYRDGTPVGWAALAPRPAYPRLLRSRTLALQEDEP